MNKKTILLSVLLALLIGGCSAPIKDRPIADNICIHLSNINQRESAFVFRKASEYLRSHGGFSLSRDSCDIKISFESFGSTSGELSQYNGLWVGRTSQNSIEGVVNIRTGANEPISIFEEDNIEIKEETRMDMLEALAEKLVKPITKHYKTTHQQ
jgi:hypothetical protein